MPPLPGLVAPASKPELLGVKVQIGPLTVTRDGVVAVARRLLDISEADWRALPAEARAEKLAETVAQLRADVSLARECLPKGSIKHDHDPWKGKPPKLADKPLRPKFQIEDPDPDMVDNSHLDLATGRPL